MSRRMMRYVMPVEDTELVINVRGGDNWYLIENDRNIYLYMEEDDEAEPELAIFKLFETGESVDGAYVGTLQHRQANTVLHLYWTNVYEGVKYDSTRNVRGSDVVPEVHDAGGSEPGAGASGQGEDVQHYLPE